MCGRARCTLRGEDVSRACGVNHGSIRTVQMDRYRPSYNVSPGHYVPVIHREEGNGSNDQVETVLHCMKWGLIPSFTKKTEKPDHYRMFNARSESISEKASFRRLIPKNRCIVAVEGFYEWKKDGSKKQPYYIHYKDERSLVFAALYDSWNNPEGEVIYTFTIVTTSSSSALQWLHDRMPVILGDKSSIDAWLNGSTPSGLNSLLKPYEDPDLVWHPVTPEVGKPSFNGPECIKEIKLKTEEKNLISKFFSKRNADDEEKSPVQVKSSPEGTADIDSSEIVKVEEKNTNLPTDSEKKNSSMSDASPFHHEEAEKHGIKRDFKELLPDTKPSSVDMIKKQYMSPPKKKVNVKTAGDKQPTLLSYFGKKQ